MGRTHGRGGAKQSGMERDRSGKERDNRGGGQVKEGVVQETRTIMEIGEGT